MPIRLDPVSEHAATAANARLERGMELRREGNLAGAIVELDAALDSFRQLFSLRHERTVTCLHELGRALANVGEHERAREILRSALDAKEALFGPAHESTLETRYEFALVAYLLGDNHETALSARACFDGFGAADDSLSQSVIFSLSLLASALLHLKRHDELLELTGAFLAAVDAFAADDAAVAAGSRSALGRIRHTRGIALRDTGAIEGALAAFKRVLAEVSERDGLWLAARLDYALALSDTGHVAHAVELLSELVAYYSSTTGAESTVTLSTMHELAIAVRKAGDHERAVELFLQLLRVRRAALGESDPLTLSCEHELAVALADANRPHEALDYARHSAAEWARIGGERAVTARTAVAGLLRRINQHSAALAEYKAIIEDYRALPAAERAYVSVRSGIALNMWQAAGARCDMGDVDRGIAELEATLVAATGELGLEKTHPTVLGCMLYLASQYRVRPDSVVRAAQLYEEVAAGRQERVTAQLDEPSAVASPLYELGVLQRKMGLVDEAISVFTRALRALGGPGADPQPDPPLLCYILHELGLALKHVERLQDAADALSDAYRNAKATFGMTSAIAATSLYELAVLLVSVGQQAEAKPLILEAVASLGESLGPTDARTLTARRALAALYNGLGDSEAAVVEFDAVIDAVAESADRQLIALAMMSRIDRAYTLNNVDDPRATAALEWAVNYLTEVRDDDYCDRAEALRSAKRQLAFAYARVEHQFPRAIAMIDVLRAAAVDNRAFFRKLTLDLAEMLSANGETDRALGVWHEYVAMMEKNPGDSSVATFNVRATIARVLIDAGRLTDAHAALDTALARVSADPIEILHVRVVRVSILTAERDIAGAFAELDSILALALTATDDKDDEAIVAMRVMRLPLLRLAGKHEDVMAEADAFVELFDRSAEMRHSARGLLAVILCERTIALVELGRDDAALESARALLARFAAERWGTTADMLAAASLLVDVALGWGAMFVRRGHAAEFLRVCDSLMLVAGTPRDGAVSADVRQTSRLALACVGIQAAAAVGDDTLQARYADERDALLAAAPDRAALVASTNAARSVAIRGSVKLD